MDKPTTLETLAGGSVISVGRADGTAEDVKVLQIPVKLWTEALKRQGNDLALVELACAKPVGWAETLSPAGFVAALAEVERVNADFFVYSARLQQKQAAMFSALAPSLDADALRKLSDLGSTLAAGSRR